MSFGCHVHQRSRYDLCHLNLSGLSKNDQLKELK